MEDMKTLLSFGLEHPARTMDFGDLKAGIFAEIDKGNISVTYHPEFPNLALFKYSIDCVADRNWNKFTLMARGLILDLEKGDVVATPFVKFFNYGEIESGSTSVIEAEYTVSEKVDGSLGIMFYFADAWRMATAGSFVSEQAVWADKWMYETMPLNTIDRTNTYLFEIVYPENKIVVQYDFSGLVLLSIVDEYGLEYAADQLSKEASYMHTKCAKLYDFDDMDSILKKAETLGLDAEGYVIRFASGIRLKIKGDEYVRIHRLMSKVTPLALWDTVLKGDNVEELKKEMPEEMEKDVDTIVSILNKRLGVFVAEVEAMHKDTESMSDKELGIYMAEHPKAFSENEFKTSKKYIFLLRKGKFYDSLNNFESLTRRKIFMAFKPKSNVLPGYIPSSVTTRFVDGL